MIASVRTDSGKIAHNGGERARGLQAMSTRAAGNGRESGRQWVCMGRGSSMRTASNERASNGSAREGGVGVVQTKEAKRKAGVLGGCTCRGTRKHAADARAAQGA
jgi:hypothetical protein